MKLLAIQKNKTTEKANYVCRYGPGPKQSWHEKLKDAREKALDTLREHPGYLVKIYKIEDKKEVPLGGFYDINLKEISSLQF